MNQEKPSSFARGFANNILAKVKVFAFEPPTKAIRVGGMLHGHLKGERAFLFNAFDKGATETHMREDTTGLF